MIQFTVDVLASCGKAGGMKAYLLYKWRRTIKPTLIAIIVGVAIILPFLWASVSPVESLQHQALVIVGGVLLGLMVFGCIAMGVYELRDDYRNFRNNRSEGEDE